MGNAPDKDVKPEPKQDEVDAARQRLKARLKERETDRVHRETGPRPQYPETELDTGDSEGTLLEAAEAAGFSERVARAAMKTLSAPATVRKAGGPTQTPTHYMQGHAASPHTAVVVQHRGGSTAQG